MRERKFPATAADLLAESLPVPACIGAFVLLYDCQLLPPNCPFGSHQTIVSSVVCSFVVCSTADSDDVVSNISFDPANGAVDLTTATPCYVIQQVSVYRCMLLMKL